MPLTLFHGNRLKAFRSAAQASPPSRQTGPEPRRQESASVAFRRMPNPAVALLLAHFHAFKSRSAQHHAQRLRCEVRQVPRQIEAVPARAEPA